MTDRRQLARESYRAYEAEDRQLIEDLLADDFTFYSPPDPGIDRARYFERCWPNAGTTESFDYVRLIESGDEVIVTYELRRPDGSGGHNTEIVSFDDEDEITRVEVYFGWDLRR
jgi:ketosteroid isomerase-like protein